MGEGTPGASRPTNQQNERGLWFRSSSHGSKQQQQVSADGLRDVVGRVRNTATRQMHQGEGGTGEHGEAPSAGGPFLRPAGSGLNQRGPALKLGLPCIC
jgi:hypothetical protein